MEMAQFHRSLERVKDVLASRHREAVKQQAVEVAAQSAASQSPRYSADPGGAGTRAIAGSHYFEREDHPWEDLATAAA